ncbi:hypothetical protein [uncultured Brevundimonas sp.]|uniref:hypothetical protein n=1 Tax=uncultured Brevundimonas sp. TaxID=213418 RepID=UPI00262C0CFC|nr:hypothetical protein [uncultured Brevundimonas sp.]
MADHIFLSFRKIDEDWKARNLWERGEQAWLMVAVAHFVSGIYHHFHADILGYDARWTNEPMVILNGSLAVLAIAMNRVSKLHQKAWLPVFCLLWIGLGFYYNFTTQIADKISMLFAFFAAGLSVGAVRAALYMTRQKSVDQTRNAA